MITFTSADLVDYYGNRTTRDAVVQGRFLHNKGPFAIWLDKNGSARLSARASVIQAAHYGDMGRKPLPQVAVGDLLEIDGTVYRIEDKVRGYDPVLVAA